MHPRVAWIVAIAVLTACGPVKAPLDANDTGSSHDPVNAETVGHAASTTLPEPTTGAILGSDGGTAPSTTTGSASTSTATSEGATFLIGPDGGPAPVECDPFAQDCPEGQRCTSYASNGSSVWDSTKCVPVADSPKHPGEVCTVEGNGVSGIDDCDAESYCWDTDIENMGTCVALCKGTARSPYCEQPLKVCATYAELTLFLCLDECNPLDQNCGPGDTCIDTPNTQDFLCILDASGDEGQQHDACEYVNECDPGLTCASPMSASECDPNASGCCQPFCDLGDPDADANCTGVDQVCLPYFEVPSPEYANIGICSVPA